MRPTSEAAENFPDAPNGHHAALVGNTPDAGSTPDPMPRLLRLRDALHDLRADADAAHEARTSGKPRGALSGLSSLDRELSGAFANGLHVLHGQPGTGKTALALQIAASARCPALFVSCEMAPAELLRRHTARATGTYLGRLKSGEMSGQSIEALALQAIEAAPDLTLIDATRAPAKADYLQKCALIARGGARHLLIVIDSLHTWTQATATEGAQEYEALNHSIKTLQTLAANLACPILMISERNRESMKSNGQSAGAGTRKIEYQGETVISLTREENAKEDGAGEVDITLTLAKNRHGATGKNIPLKFHGALQKFTEASEARP